MCYNINHNLGRSTDCFCHCKTNNSFLSQKKKIEQLKKELALLEEKTDDLREFINELETEK